eukprot:1187699-Lingulodinium_polyedra.AAC.1
MSPPAAVELIRDWAATIAVAAHPRALVEREDWADTGATCVPVGGDGYTYVCQSLLDEGQPEEPT